MGIIQYLEALGYVAVFTFLFDMVDLKPEAGSYGFVKSISYLIYWTFRTALGLVAVVILVATNVSLPMFVLGLVGTLVSITMLQSLNLSIGGEKIANLESLMQRFRQDILSDNANRIARGNTRRTYRAVNRLASLDEPPLQLELGMLVARLSFTGGVIEARLHRQLQGIPENQKELRQRVYAWAIVDAANAIGPPGILESILENHFPKRPWWRRG